MKITLRSILIAFVAVCTASVVWATDLPVGYEDPEHGEAHTYVGINWDQIPGTADDNKLWVSAPQTLEDGDNSFWPNWDTIELLPQFDDLGNAIVNGLGQQLYIAAEPDGWFSAHPGNGAWQLGGTDESVIPGWNISIKRITATDGFFMLRLNDGQVILDDDGQTETMHKEWEQWLENGTGGYGTWGCHHHISFCVWADGDGQSFSATFAAIDTGTTQYAQSDPFTINFVTVPEPMSLSLLALGLAFVRRKSNYAVR